LSIFFCSILSNAQNNFGLINNAKKQSISFKLNNNLVIIPIVVNGKKLNFILDSGVGSTILFNINKQDSVPLHNVKKVKLKGLGKEEAIDAILSQGNKFQIKNVVGSSQKLYVIFDDSFDLSSKLGTTIHGIIGYDILKDFVVKISYSKKRITFYDSNLYRYPDCKKCETLNLEFDSNKPYINVGAKLSKDPNKITPVKLLIDSGGSDSMWLFENSHPDILEPEKYFDDFLGEGLSGAIYGKRAIIKSLLIGMFELKQPTVSYPDSASIAEAMKFKERNGSIGANILKRFTVTFDYKGEKITLKKGSSFKDPFRYNMSGIELAYNGKILVKEHDNADFELSQNLKTNKNNTVILSYKYKYTFKNSYKIFKIQNNSPAALAGLKVNDIVIRINGKFAHEMKLEEIVAKFYQKEGKRINLVIERNGQDYEYRFKLKNMLN